MDQATLQSLLTALAATPDNIALRLVVARGMADLGQNEEAGRTLLEVGLGELTPEQGREAGDLLVLAGSFEAALDLPDDGSAEMAMVRARALVNLDRYRQAKEAYEKAVEMNSTLEDPDLKARIQSREVVTEGRPRLRVIDQDDTSREILHTLHPEVEPVTFKDVGGLDDVKAQVRKRIILPFQKPSIFQRFKKRIGGGLLLYGPPGCGKTLLARATAGECEASMFNVAIHDILDMWMGESEQKLHAIFEKARASTPAVIFFDEIEALGGKRQHSRSQSMANLVSQFLSEMDGFEKENSGVLILAATNVPWDVDSAFRRPGRFDRTLFVPPPDREAREAILKIHLEGRPVGPDIDVAWLAKHTSGFSGADIQNLIETAADEAIAASLEAEMDVPIAHKELKAALADVRPTTTEWLTTARNYARYANEGGQYDDVLAFLAKHGKG